MRCPKCGYISFDHLEQCLKCKKNIKAVSETLHGTVFHVATPTFLQLRREAEEKPKAEEMFAGDLEGDDEFIDDDLDVLVDDDSLLKMDESSDDDGEDSGESVTPPVEADDSEDREIAIDFSQFEDTEEQEVSSQGSKKVPDEGDAPPLSLDFPADLADLSDLAPPARNTANEKPAGRSSAKAEATMDDLNFDLGLENLEADLASDGDSGKEMILALDDIDFSETLTQEAKKPADKGRGADMNEDLNFDLDLGGLSIHKD